MGNAGKHPFYHRFHAKNKSQILKKMEESFFGGGLLIVKIVKIYQIITDLKEFSMECPRKLRTFADEISIRSVCCILFDVSQQSKT